jgi:energy-coupling factor transporter ATPase
MSIIKVENLKHRFLDKDEEGKVISDKMALDDVSLEIKQGDFIAILGHNGSGKSTFAKHLNAILMPYEGEVYVAGMNTKENERIWDIRQNAGMVFQNPDNQIIATIVEEDVGFGPENLGVETEEIWKRVNYALERVGMVEYRKHSPNKLSGGQKQRVAIAGVLAMKPKCIILDEPTAMLDPNGRKEVINTIKELNKKEKVTIILVTHYMDEVIDADYVYVMDKGKVALKGTPAEVFSNVEKIYEIGLDVPQPTEIAYLLEKSGKEMPRGILRSEELINQIIARGYIEKHNKTKNIASNNDENRKINDLRTDNNISDKNISDNIYEEADKVILEADNISYVYGEGTTYEKKAIDSVSFKINQGEIIGIIGHTGSGKSTLICHLNGLNQASSGEVRYMGKNIYDKNEKLSDLRKNVGIVFQYPEYQLFESTVLEDVCFGAKNKGMNKEQAIETAKKVLAMVGVGEEFYNRSPFELSGGEKRRVAIAGVLAMMPQVLILDEPTAGLDPKGRDEILNLLKSLNEKEGLTIVIVSHSMEDMGKFANRLLVMSKGKLIFDDTPRKVFRQYKKLEEIGLAAPKSVYIFDELKQKGLSCDGVAITPREVVEGIIC